MSFHFANKVGSRLRAQGSIDAGFGPTGLSVSCQRICSAFPAAFDIAYQAATLRRVPLSRRTISFPGIATEKPPNRLRLGPWPQTQVFAPAARHHARPRNSFGQTGPKRMASERPEPVMGRPTTTPGYYLWVEAFP